MSGAGGDVGTVLRAVAAWLEVDREAKSRSWAWADREFAARAVVAIEAMDALSPEHLRALAAQAEAGAGATVAESAAVQDLTIRTDVSPEQMDALGAELAADMLHAVSHLPVGTATMNLDGPEMTWALTRLGFPMTGAQRLSITYALAQASAGGEGGA